MSALIPADHRQCQAEKPNGYNFMTLGGRPGLERCRNKPVVIAIENQPGPDGLIGSMSLCEECKAVFLRQYGDQFAKLQEIVDHD